MFFLDQLILTYERVTNPEMETRKSVTEQEVGLFMSFELVTGVLSEQEISEGCIILVMEG